MPRATDEPTTRVHAHLYTSDVEFIRAHFGGMGNIGQNAAIRTMVRRVVRALKAQGEASARPVQLAEDELENPRYE